METSQIRKRVPASALLDPKIVWPGHPRLASSSSIPRTLAKNPVMFVVEVVAALTTVIFLRDLVTGGENLGFTFQIIFWLWFTVLFANFAEAIAEGRGKAQADSLRRQRTETQAKLLAAPDSSDFTARPEHRPQGRRHRAGRGRRHHSVGRRGDRGRRVGQRGRDHRRIGAGDPRIRRRPLGRDRRHAGAVRLDPRAHHRGARARPSSTA